MKKTALFSSPPKIGLWRKTILIMKLTTFLILITALQVSAKTFSQEKVSVHFEKTRLDKALKEVENKSSFRFVFSNRLISENLRVTLKANDIKVEDLLQQMLTNTDLTFNVMSNNLIVIKKAGIAYTAIPVNGKITDQEGKADRRCLPLL
jgi:type II secretory pathway component GspD/PulD (secretin)